MSEEIGPTWHQVFVCAHQCRTLHHEGGNGNGCGLVITVTAYLGRW